MKVKPYSKTEMFIVAGVMFAILMPLRLISVFILGEHNFVGSILLLTGVTSFIMIGAKKEKLGRFGNMFINTILKIQKGKRKYIFYGETTFVLLVMGSAVILIHEGNTTYGNLKSNVVAQLAEFDIKTTDDVINMSENISPEEQLEAIISMPSLLINEFAAVAITAAVINDMMDGWYMYFATLIIIENVQIVGFLTIARKYFKAKQQETQP